MKGVQGMVIAVALGLAAGLCNWYYLEKLASQEEKISFIAIQPGVQINVGDRIRADQVAKVEIPRSGKGNLEQIAPRWDLLSTVLNTPSTRSYRGGEIVLFQDVESIAQRNLNEKLGKGEVALWIPIDTRTFNPSRVNPEDEVSFVLPPVSELGPTRAGSVPGSTGSEIIGPFRILEIGSRTGKIDVQKAAGVRQTSESSITIVAKLSGGQLDEKAERVSKYVRLTKAQGLQVLLHPKQKAN